MATDPVSSVGSSSTSKKSQNDPLRGLDLDEFLKLMIAELQNQDPLNPLENSDILAQISQIREIGATDKMSSTLDSVLLGQQLSNAGTLISKKITGLATDGKNVTGLVERVSMDNGKAVLHIGDASVPLANVREVVPAGD
ncbi:MAG: flagellar biosynthesis protein FlgD [Pirellulales bacterium]|nr:flagellar biosynthesis protein FlgD [Pirellulales bacterium]